MGDMREARTHKTGSGWIHRGVFMDMNHISRKLFISVFLLTDLGFFGRESIHKHGSMDVEEA